MENFFPIPNSQRWTNISLKCDLTLASTVKKETDTNSCNEDAKSFAEKKTKLVISMIRQDSDSYLEKN